jgi:hypothetical protein
MDYQTATAIVRDNYQSQADLLMKSLCPQAIITLATLCNQNTKRSMTSFTINNLSSMEPHRQVGFIANPFLEFLIGRCLDTPQAQAHPVTTAPPNKKTNSKLVPAPAPSPAPKPDPKPEPEVEEEPSPIDIFDLF